MTRPKGDAQPEALATFAEAAKTRDKTKPAGQGETATAATAGKPGDLKREQKDAARIVQAGAEKKPAKANVAIEDVKKIDKRSP